MNMKDKRVLVVSSEVVPYLPENEISSMSFEAPRMVNKQGGQIRIFMPRYGNINERRHQLHEVIRLSGINLVINDLDMPLIIKVASIPKERIQVYFIDNEEYFMRKATTSDQEGNFFNDNDERMIFFDRGAIETTKKLRWTPDIIHCHGWMSALVQLLIKKAYNDDPLFENSKVIYSLYDDDFKGTLNNNIKKKLEYDGIKQSDIKTLSSANYVNLQKLAISYSDAIIQGNAKVNDDVINFAKESGKAFLDYKDKDEYLNAYNNFYNKILN